MDRNFGHFLIALLLVFVVITLNISIHSVLHSAIKSIPRDVKDIYPYLLNMVYFSVGISVFIGSCMVGISWFFFKRMSKQNI